jgi:phosphoadenosine phosphosulfate reductase
MERHLMLRYINLMGESIDKVEAAIKRLKSFEPPDGYYLAFSGGKDSCCIKELANMAGVKYDAHYNVTTVDPPELTRFILKYHPDVTWTKPELPMRKLIVKKLIPPTRIARYCCQVLKESNGEGRVVVTGVRWAESNRRRRQHGVARVGDMKDSVLIMNDDNDESRRMVEQCYRIKKTMVNPIVDWEDEDVWEFIHERNLPYCSLYDEGFKRLGCVGCPMGDTNGMTKDFDRWPQYKKMYLKAFELMLKARKEKGKTDTGMWADAQSLFDWWIRSKGKQVDADQITLEVDEWGGE